MESDFKVFTPSIWWMKEPFTGMRHRFGAEENQEFSSQMPFRHLSRDVA